ncbi:hypothetical protein LOAG_15497, partial [Loa loa]
DFNEIHAFIVLSESPNMIRKIDNNGPPLFNHYIKIWVDKCVNGMIERRDGGNGQ